MARAAQAQRSAVGRHLRTVALALLVLFAISVLADSTRQSGSAAPPRFEYRRDLGFADHGVARFPQWNTVLALQEVADGAVLAQLGRLDAGGVLVDAAVAKLHDDGTLDTAFAGGGPTPGILQLGGPAPRLFVRRDGTFLIGTVRYRADGTVDAVQPGLDLGSTAVAYLESAGEQLIGMHDMAVGAYGCQLTHFADDGVPGITIGLNSRCERAVPLPNGDGRVVVIQDGLAIRLVFLTDDGRLDTSRGGGSGVVAVDGAVAAAGALVDAVRQSNKILLELRGSGSNDETVVARIGTDGTLDHSFGTGGVTRLSGAPLSLHATDDVVTVHIRYTFAIRANSPYHPTIVVLRPDGALDRQFNPNGRTPGWWDVVEVGFGELVLDWAHLDLARGRVMIGFADDARPGDGVSLVVVEPTAVQLAVIVDPAVPLRPATRLTSP